MTENINKLYSKSYNSEFHELTTQFEEIFNPARDKKYAIEIVLAMYIIPYAFNNSSKLTTRINELYDFQYKLGSEIEEIIKMIPELIKEYKDEVEKYNEQNKNKVTPSFYKLFGFIPIWIKNYQFEFDSSKNPYMMAGPFADLSELLDITIEFGRLRALNDFIENLKLKYYQHGGNGFDDIGKGNKLSEKWHKLKTALKLNDLSNFFLVLKAHFASLPYDIKIQESYYHGQIHTILDILGFEIFSELQTNKGRIDAYVETDNYIHIMEFKIDNNSAMKQINEKKYYERFLDSNKKIILVGVNFSKKDKEIINWDFKNLN